MPKFLSDGFFDGSSTDLTVDGKINISDYIVHTGDTNSYFGFGLNDYIKFVTSGSEKFYISSSNVTSITTHDFLSNLYTSNVTGRTDTDTKIEFPGSDVMTFKTGNSERIKINASGYVGINETNPEQMLHVAGNFRLENQLYDSTNSQGSVGQILSKVSAGTQWIDQGDVIAGEADKAKSVILRVKNSTASAMSKGQVVCEAVSATPPNGSLIEVALADNNGTNTMPALGILNDDLDAAGGNNDEGDAIMFGKVSGIDTSAFSVGDEVFVDDTPGGLTTTKPTGVKYIQKVGVVIRDDDTNGTIEVFGAGRTNDVPTPLYIDHTNQRLGIGETDPSEKLHVDGRAYIESQGVDWNETTPGTGRGSLHFDPVGDGADNTGNAITFGASDTSNGSNAQAGIYTRSDGTYGTKMYFATTNLYTAGSKTRMMIDYDGDVGVGTASPEAKLDVNGNIKMTETAATTDTDKFVVLDSGVLKYRTGSQLLSDIGGTDGSDSLQLIDVSEPGNTTAEWSLIKTLPVTTGSTRDTLFIKVVGGAWNDHGRYEAEITLSNRDSFNYFWEVKGGDEYNINANGSNRLRVIAYSQTDGTVDVYLYKAGYMTGYIYATFQNTGGPEIITSLGSPATIQPSGTVVFSTHGEAYPANISSVNGKVGINAAYPGKMLELRGGANEAAIRLRDTESNVWDIQNSTLGKLDFIRGGSSTYMRIDQLGHVGIGATNPSFLLDIGDSRNDNDVFRVNGSNADVLFSGNVTAPTGGVGLWNFINTGTNATTRFYVQDANNSNDRLTFRFTGNGGSNEILSGTSLGRVGIGTTQPNRLLTVQTTATGCYLALNSSSNNTTIGSDVNGSFIIYDDSSSAYRMVIDAATGDVGIGTTDPASQLHVRNDDAETATAAGITVEQDGTGDAIVQYLLTDVKRWTTGIDNSDGDKFKISQNTDLATDNVMTFDTAGKVGIGTTSPLYKLEVFSDSDNYTKFGGLDSTKSAGFHSSINNFTATAPFWLFEAVHGTTGRNNEVFRIHSNETGSSSKTLRVTSQGTTATPTYEALSVDYIGNVGIGTTTPGAKLEVDSNDAFRTVQLTGTSPAIYFNEDDSASTDNWHLGVNGGILYFLRDTDKNGAYNNIAAYFSGNNLISEGNFYAKGNTFSFGASTSEGEYISRSGNDIRFIAGGGTRMSVDGGNGYVGIGYTDPQEKLHVYNGSAYITPIAYAANQNDWVIRAGAYNSTSFDQGLKLKSSSGGVSYMAFETTGNTETMVLRGGKVGIGTADPGQKLEVEGSIRLSKSNDVTSGFELGRDGSTLDAFIIQRENADLFFRTNNSEKMRIEAGGNVGIGTDNPNHELVVQGASSPNIELKNSNYSDGGFVLNRTNYTQQWKWWAQSSQMYFSFATDESTYSAKMTIQSDGDVGIGTTSPSDKLEVAGNIKTIYNGKIGFRYTSGDSNMYQYITANGNSAMSFYNNYSSGLTYTAYSFKATSSNTDVLTILSGGNVGIGQTNPSTYKLDVTGTIRATGDVIAYSDIRVKENIKTINNALDKVKALRGVEYNKIDNPEKSIGVIAQEIEEVIPEVVKEDDQGMKSVAYGNITAVLIEAIKEQQKQIDELKKQLDAFTK